jgi:nitroreductase
MDANGPPITPDTWRELLATAIRAPSPHNVQPWRVRLLNHSEAELLIERRRTLPDEDVDGSFIILTMGGFVETLQIVAAHFGLSVTTEPAADLGSFTASRIRARSEAHIPFARLRLEPAEGLRSPYALDLLAARRTSRLPYRRDPVVPADAVQLDALAQQWGQRYHQVTDPAQIERILQLNIAAAFHDLNHPPYRNELAAWIRYSQGASARARDGLDARCMNQAPLELWIAFHAPWLLQVPVARDAFARRYRQQIAHVTTLGMLDGPFWDPRDAFESGRFLTHFWLEVTRLGYFIHPYGNLVTNRPIAARVAAETKLERTWLVFKIGRSDDPPLSHRRSVDEVLL